MHVGAAGERAALATDDRDLRLRFEIKPSQRVRQVPDQLVAERVEPVGPVQRQSGDLISAVIFD
jgi:hypothetical protein